MVARRKVALTRSPVVLVPIVALTVALVLTVPPIEKLAMVGARALEP